MNRQKPATGKGPRSPRSGMNAVSDFVDDVINRAFALTDTAANTRYWVVLLLFFISWFVMTISVPGLARIRELITTVWVSISINDVPGFVNNTINLVFSTFLSPVVVQHMIIMATPFWLMYLAAGAYLADIFEKDRAVAEKFIRQAAFGRNYDSITINNGKISEVYKNSPIIQIGGPGKIIVGLDSAVLFELPDGSFHIIGPMNENNHENAISAFERIRATIDLRDDINSQTVKARTLDGIPVIARDIQYSYSIFRGPVVRKSLQIPYPFDINAIRTQVYGVSKPAKPDEMQVYKPDWESPLPGKFAGQVSGAISSFVNQRSLSEFLANIGTPEQDSKVATEKKINLESQRLSELNDEIKLSNDEPVGNFTSRTQMTALLYKTIRESSQKKGLYLNWLGVGTWDTPAEIIPARHLQAWQLSRDNFIRGNPEAIARLRNEIRLQELLRLVRITPISRVDINSEQAISSEKIDLLLKDYLERLESARDLFKRDDKIIEEQMMVQAIEIIKKVLQSKAPPGKGDT